MTAQDLITRALKRLQVLQPSETPSNEDAQDALDLLNELIDAWKVESLTVFTHARTTWTITANDGEYTVGSGGDIACVRPTQPDTITVGYIDTSADPDHETLIAVLTESHYAGIAMKAQTAGTPSGAYYNPSFGSTGLGALSLFPVPTSTTLTGVIYAPAPLDEFALISTVFYAPPGYRRFLLTNLALELAPHFNKVPLADLREAARESKANIKRANQRLMDLSIDPRALIGASGWYDITTNEGG